MKDKKKFLIVFAISWIIGITGGYLLGVGSALLPTEDVSYNYYFTENVENSEVEQIKKTCGEKEVDDVTHEDDESDNSFYIIIKNVGVYEIPRRLINHYLK